MTQKHVTVCGPLVAAISAVTRTAVTSAFVQVRNNGSNASDSSSTVHSSTLQVDTSASPVSNNYQEQSSQPEKQKQQSQVVLDPPTENLESVIDKNKSVHVDNTNVKMR